MLGAILMSYSAMGRNHCLSHFFPITLLLGFAACVAGCTRAELESKSEAYDTAIAESNNAQILLNAVRASQRAPMSFVGLGDLSAQPAVTASTNGTFNLSPSGLLGYNLNPSVSVSGGFATYQLSNLNRSEFMKAMQKPVKKTLVDTFFDLDWPDELIHLMIIRKIVLTRDEFTDLVRRKEAICASMPQDQSGHYEQICAQLQQDELEYQARCPIFILPGSEIEVLNTAREFCSMKKFQTLLRIYRLLRFTRQQLALKYKSRSPQEILYYLGELIAAQNYSTNPYCPTIFVGQAGGGPRHLVPLFVVRREGAVPGPAAVSVSYNGEVFYIPKPDLGSVDEARSLQVLDFVNQVIVMVTTDKDLPKSNAGTLVLAH
jgi:hypothetical protein